MEPDVLEPQLHVLARAVVRQKGKILLARAKGFENTFLPGGHLEPGESLHACLRRELREELGLGASVGAYLGVIEHTYKDAGGRHFELCHLFGVSLEPSNEAFADGPLNSREPHLTFVWAETDKLTEHNLEPAPLRHLLRDSVASSAVWASTLPNLTAGE